jgi:hypothetical protein
MSTESEITVPVRPSLCARKLLIINNLQDCNISRNCRIVVNLVDVGLPCALMDARSDFCAHEFEATGQG